MRDWREGGFDKHIVVLGGGFAGVNAARRLVKNFRGDTRVHVTLVNEQNYFVFQPLLPEVAAGTLEATTTVNPIRQLIPDVDFDCATVESIDLGAQQIHLKAMEGQRAIPMPFDHLVLAMGTVSNLSVIPGMAEHGLPMKDLSDAFFLRHHMIRKLEEAANEADEATRKEIVAIVVVGGGFSGVETAAELHEAMIKASYHYPEIDDDEPQVYLVQSGDRILPELSPELSARAKQILDDRPGIEIILHDRVSSVTPTSVTLKSGRVIRTRTVICTIGNCPNPTLAGLDLPMERGRVVASPSLQVKGKENLWALGDLALIPNAADGQLAPPTAQFAIREGRVCADNIKRVLEGKAPLPFRHVSQGMLASLGLHSAVAELNLFGTPVRFSGFVAWWMWRTIYLMKLPGWFRRLRVALDWTLDLLFRRDLVNLDVRQRSRIGRGHYEAGQTVIRQGDIATNFYIIHHGHAEVVRLDDAGAEAVVARLGPGDHFGEDALKAGGRRMATVRALTTLDVFSLGDEDFGTLVEALAPMRQALEEARQRREAPELSLLGDEGLAWLKEVPVAEVMSEAPETLGEEATLRQLFEAFDEGHFSCYPIVDKKDLLVGLVTRTDLYKAIGEDRPLATPLSEIMSRAVATVFTDDSADTAIHLLRRRGLKRVLVVDRGAPRSLRGILSPMDLFRAKGAREARAGGGADG